jgi:hypothetical protein
MNNINNMNNMNNINNMNNMNNMSLACSHGSYKVSDIDWVVNAISTLKRNDWPAESPLLFDGTGWGHQFRECAAVNLLQALRDNTSVRKLVMRNATLELKAETAFHNMLKENSHLRTISLADLRCGGGHRITLPTALFENSALEELTLLQCSLDAAACQALTKMLLTKKSSLTSLTLVHVDCPGGGLTCLTVALTQARSLQQLTLEHMDWTTGRELGDFLQAASANPSLRVLRLEHMNLSVEVAPQLARLLRTTKLLTELSLRENNLDSAAIQVVVQDGLAHNHSLTILQLSSNPVGNDGAQHLAECLEQQNSTLQELCLQQTQIGRQGCLALCDALFSTTTTTSLRRLVADGNEMEACGPALLQALARNVTLTTVLLCIPRLVQEEQSTTTAMRGGSSSNTNTWAQIDLLLRLNKAKRRVLVEKTNVNPLLLPLILESAAISKQADVLYCLLRAMPDALTGRPKADDLSDKVQKSTSPAKSFGVPGYQLHTRSMMGPPSA